MSWLKKKSEAAKPTVNRVEGLANRLHRERRGSEIESSLQGFDYGSLTEREKESWHQGAPVDAATAGVAFPLERRESHGRTVGNVPGSRSCAIGHGSNDEGRNGWEHARNVP